MRTRKTREEPPALSTWARDLFAWRLVFVAAVFTLMISGCTHSAQVLVEKNDSGDMVVRLISQDDDVWKLKDSKHDIVVSRRKDGVFNINMDITRPHGGTLKINSDINLTPGQTLLLASFDNEKLFIEIPEK